MYDLLQAAQAEWQRFFHLLQTPVETQENVLQECLLANQNSAFGRQYGFAGMNGSADFRSRVPISTYTEYEVWMQQCAPGKSQVLTTEETAFFLTSSGSTGNPKKIPATKTYFRQCYLPAAYISLFRLLACAPETAARYNDTLNFKWDPVAEQAGDAVLGLSQADWSARTGGGSNFEPGSGAPWAAPPGGISQLNRLYYRLRIAAGYKPLFAIMGINPRLLASVPGLLEMWGETIVREIHDGTLWGKPFTKPQPERAKELGFLLEYSGTLLPAQIWPQLKIVYGWMGGCTAVYRNRYYAAYGYNTELFSAPLAATEGLVAIPVNRSSFGGTLALPYSFLEFIDGDKAVEPGAATKLFNELEPGKCYHVVFSHIGGFYRYAPGDMLRVTEIVKGIPYVVYAGRNNPVQSGPCRIQEPDWITAVANAFSGTEYQPVNFSCFAGETEPVLPVAIEVAGTQLVKDADVLTGLIDAALQKENAGYALARKNGEHKGIVLSLLKPGGFFREWVSRVESGIRPAQCKDRPVIRDKAEWERLLNA